MNRRRGKDTCLIYYGSVSLDQRRFHGSFEAAVAIYSFICTVLLLLALKDLCQLFFGFHRTLAAGLSVVLTIFVTLAFHFYHLCGVAGAALLQTPKCD